MEKACKICGERKPLTDFYKMAEMRDGHRNDCKACNLAAKKRRYDADPATAIARVQRWQVENWDRHLERQRMRRTRPETKRRERAGHLKRKYGITLEEYDAMLEAQGGVCAICGSPPHEVISLHVDHDHATGENRGLLCVRCNNAIGLLQEDPALFAAAVGYLGRRR